MPIGWQVLSLLEAAQINANCRAGISTYVRTGILLRVARARYWLLAEEQAAEASVLEWVVMFTGMSV